MLTALLLRDTEAAALSRHQTLALEHLLHERLSEVARARKAGDSALLFAIRAADYLAALLEELGEDATAETLARTRAGALGRAAFARLDAVAALTESSAA